LQFIIPACARDKWIIGASNALALGEPVCGFFSRGREHRLRLPRLMDRTTRRQSTVPSFHRWLDLNRRRWLDRQVGRVQIILAGNAD
jgi:hypothetical protein